MRTRRYLALARLLARDLGSSLRGARDRRPKEGTATAMPADCPGPHAILRRSQRGTGSVHDGTKDMANATILLICSRVPTLPPSVAVPRRGLSREAATAIWNAGSFYRGH